MASLIALQRRRALDATTGRSDLPLCRNKTPVRTRLLKQCFEPPEAPHCASGTRSTSARPRIPFLAATRSASSLVSKQGGPLSSCAYPSRMTTHLPGQSAWSRSTSRGRFSNFALSNSPVSACLHLHVFVPKCPLLATGDCNVNLAYLADLAALLIPALVHTRIIT